LLDGILSLVGAGFQVNEIYDFPLDIFYMYLETANRLEAKKRLGYIADTTASVAALFAKPEATKEYRAGLEKQYLGEDDGNGNR